MVLRVLFLALSCLFFIGKPWAEELKINPQHPDQYTVVKGDTLWDISGKFLQHPWQWPQLWHNNPQIKDAHWIYPGETLYFSYVNGEPRLSMSRDSYASERNDASERVEPRIRESDVEAAIPMIPSDAIAQFLSSPKVVNKEEISQAPYVVNIGGNDRIIGGIGDTVYVRAISSATANLNYNIFRPGDAYINPDTNEILGYEADYVGDATLVATGDPATLLVTRSHAQIHPGDRLMPNNQTPLALNYFPRPPDHQIFGHIIRVLSGVIEIGQHDIVVIDKGAADGLQAGHVLNIFREGLVVNDIYHSDHTEKVKLPDEYSGVLMVFRPFERVSYALVMEALGSVHTMDRVQTP